MNVRTRTAFETFLRKWREKNEARTNCVDWMLDVTGTGCLPAATHITSKWMDAYVYSILIPIRNSQARTTQEKMYTKCKFNFPFTFAFAWNWKMTEWYGGGGACWWGWWAVCVGGWSLYPFAYTITFALFEMKCELMGNSGTFSSILCEKWSINRWIELIACVSSVSVAEENSNERCVNRISFKPTWLSWRIAIFGIWNFEFNRI